MAKFVLVHGSWQGAWCWREMIPRLVSLGHDAVAFDLPGHGEDPTPVESVTFQHYVDRTLQEVATSEEPPILVGHSMGGAIISQTVEAVPDRIRALVGVAALMPASGASMMSFVEGFDPEYLAQIQWSPDRRTAVISPEAARRFWCSECPPALVDTLLPLLGPEPAAPYGTPLSLTETNFGRVPRYYIEGLRDRIVSIALQRSIRAAVPFAGVYSLEADHAPYFSKPDELAQVLHTIAEQC